MSAPVSHSYKDDKTGKMVRVIVLNERDGIWPGREKLLREDGTMCCMGCAAGAFGVSDRYIRSKSYPNNVLAPESPEYTGGFSVSMDKLGFSGQKRVQGLAPNYAPGGLEELFAYYVLAHLNDYYVSGKSTKLAVKGIRQIMEALGEYHGEVWRVEHVV